MSFVSSENFWDFWRRHRRKIFVSFGVLGSGYLLYKLYDAHKSRQADLETELSREQDTDELIKAQMQAHFENIQRIADTTTLPHAIHYISGRIAEDLDHLHLIKRLERGKSRLNTLAPSEKLELWDRLKILSFTRMLMSVWAVSLLSLYIGVQVNILGRHLYIDTARALGSFHLLEDADPINGHDQQLFLASADFLSNYRIPSLVSDMKAAATEVLKEKHLRDLFSASVLQETTMHIMDKFMSAGNPYHWIKYLMPEDAKSYKLATASNGDNISLPDVTKFEQLMGETRTVLSSAEFGKVVEVSLNAVVNALMEEVKGGSSTTPEVPLAKILPRVAEMGQSVLREPNENPFVKIIRNIPEVERFFTLLYANTPS